VSAQAESAPPVPMARRRTGPLLLLLASLAGLVVGSLAAAQLRRRIAQGPPLVAPTDLAVAPDGTLFVAVAAGRVQVYDAEGRYLRGFLLDDGAGPARLRLVPPDRIEVATSATGRLHTFDREGALVASVHDADAWRRFGASEPTPPGGSAADGARFALEAGAVVRSTPAPPRVVIAPPPAPLAWFASAPVPLLTVLLTASGLGLVFGAALTGERRTA